MEKPTRRGGIKRASWLTFHRRLFLVRRLVRGPADPITLIADTRAFFNQSDDTEDIYPTDERTALRRDLAALRDEFECTIDYVNGCYQLSDYGRLALLDLADEDLEALAFLMSNFAFSALPNAPRVAALLDRIVALLPPERRQGLMGSLPLPPDAPEHRGGSKLQRSREVRLDYPVPSRSIDQQLLAHVRRALGRQQISFAYRSSYVTDDSVELHRVAPYELIFRDGHHYLDAYCYDCSNPTIAPRYRLYRIDRMVADSLELLPTVLPPIPPLRPHYRLHYTLSPMVARQRDIALWFPGSDAHFLPDGSADVHAECSDLWQARQILIRYREQCTVHEPPELVEMMRETALRMAEQYR
jgi:predicted DNA-binding transcriptional regulator YafY